jgi:nucleotide-binding universal stress UspA family protein
MTGRIQLLLPSRASGGGQADIDGAVALAHALGAELTASVVRAEPVAATLWPGPELVYPHVVEPNPQSAADIDHLKQAASEAGEKAGVAVRLVEMASGVVSGENAAVMTARTHDLSILGMIDHDAGLRRLAEELLFDSGRPVLVLPLSRPFAPRWDKIAVAWDHSEPASRVLSGALPVLKLAREACVISVLGARKLAREETAQEAAAYLRSHGVATTVEALESEDRARGRFIMEAAIARGASLLIMGAYSTPRASEYILGGVTLSVLNEPLLPVLMAN